MPQLPELLFVTNPDHEDADEDAYLARELSDTFDVHLVSPSEAATQIADVRRCLIRNAWPSRQFKQELESIVRIGRERNIKLYNPAHRTGYVEDKRYIGELQRLGYPVIPTVFSATEIDRLPSSASYLIKPNDGCSSFGIETVDRNELMTRNPNGYLIQPELDFKNEVSFYFIDDQFEYAMESAGKGRRWELTLFQPSADDIRWAQRFVDWNKLPYGIQRIDACRMPSGELFLMEIEDQMPLLSILELSKEVRERLCSQIKTSLMTHLG